MGRDSRDTRGRDAMDGGARYQAPIAAAVCGAVGQLPRAAGVRLGGRRGTGSHWGCLKAAASNGTSERAVPRSGPPSCSTGAAACPSLGLRHPSQGLSSGQDGSRGCRMVLACLTSLILPLPGPCWAQTLLPALAPRCQTRVLHAWLHPAPTGAGNQGNGGTTGAGQEHQHFPVETAPQKPLFQQRLQLTSCLSPQTQALSVPGGQAGPHPLLQA